MNLIIPTQRAGLLTPKTFTGTLLETINHIEANTSLLCVFDAGANTSYPSSSQTWYDETSHSYDLARGSSTGSDSYDPVFYGTYGALTSAEYFRMWNSANTSSGEFRTYSATPIWADSFHKNNAAFTVGGVIYQNATSNAQLLLDIFRTSSTNFGGDVGIFLGYNAYPTFGWFSFDVWRDATDQIIEEDTTAGLINSAWNFFAISFDEATGALMFYCNGAVENFTGVTYASPSTAEASQKPYNIFNAGYFGAANQDWFNLGACFFASRAWSQTELDRLFDHLKSRWTFGSGFGG